MKRRKRKPQDMATHPDHSEREGNTLMDQQCQDENCHRIVFAENQEYCANHRGQHGKTLAKQR